jgi:hypothetical protein
LDCLTPLLQSLRQDPSSGTAAARRALSLLQLDAPLTGERRIADRDGDVVRFSMERSSFDRVENTRLARYVRDFLLEPKPPEPESISTLLQKDLEISKLRLIECREPRDRDVWLHSLLNVARTLNPYLPPAEAQSVWARFAAAPCFATLRDFQRRWITLFAAVAARDGARSAALATELLATQADLTRDAREYLLMAGMTGYLASNDPQRAKALWTQYEDQIRGAAKPVFRLLRCHAERGTGGEVNDAACAAAFAAYAED